MTFWLTHCRCGCADEDKPVRGDVNGKEDFVLDTTLSEDLRVRIDALKDVALAHWREHGQTLYTPEAMPRLHFHVEPEPIVNINTFYTLSTGLILQGSKRSTTDGRILEYGKGTSCTVAADAPASYEITAATPRKPFVSISVELDTQVLSDLLASCPEIAARHKNVVIGHSAHAFTAMTATVDIVEAFERLVRLVMTSPEQIASRCPIIERELTYILLMSPQGAALSQFFSQNTPANRINRAIQWIRKNTGKPLDIEALAELDFLPALPESDENDAPAVPQASVSLLGSAPDGCARLQRKPGRLRSGLHEPQSILARIQAHLRAAAQKVDRGKKRPQGLKAGPPFPSPQKRIGGAAVLTAAPPTFTHSPMTEFFLLS